MARRYRGPRGLGSGKQPFGPVRPYDPAAERLKIQENLRIRLEQINEGMKLSGAGATVEEEDGITTAVIDPSTDREIPQADLKFFDTVHVAQISNKPDDPRNYGQGPTASTRMCSHKFIIDTTTYAMYGARVGWVCVRFHKNGRNGPDYVYGPVPFDVYKAFANSSSKGKFINNVLNGYGYRPASEEFAQYFADFSTNSGTDSAGIKL